MPATDAQIRANQMNAAKSTGPKTAEGKAVSRANGLKHGLSGAGIVVAEVERNQIEALVEAFEVDMRPISPQGEVLIRRMATLSVRMDTAARQEAATRAGNVRHAADRFDEERIDAAKALFATLADDPRDVVRKLKKSPEGVDRLLDAWQDLRLDLTSSLNATWTVASLEKAAGMTGLKAEHARGSRLGALTRAADGDFTALTEADGAGLGTKARQGWARGQLLTRIDLEMAGLEAHRATLDHQAIELDRAEAGGRALFDTSQQAILTRRYEAEAQSGFFKALKEFRQVEAESLDRLEAAAELAAAPAPGGRLGSSRELAGLTPPGFDTAWYEERMAQTPVVRGDDGEPIRMTQNAKTTT